MATPIPSLPVTPPSLPVQLPKFPTPQTCLVQIGLTVNGVTSGIVGSTRSHLTYTVQANWCQAQFALLFSSLTVQIDFSPSSPAFSVKLTPDTDWITQVVVPYVDGDGYWLPAGDTTFTAKVSDFLLVGGVALPGGLVPSSYRFHDWPTPGSIPVQNPIVSRLWPSQPGISPIRTPIQNPVVSRIPNPDVPNPPDVPSVPNLPDVPSVPSLPSTSYDLNPPGVPSIPSPSTPGLPSISRLPAPTAIVTSNTTLFPPTSFTGTVQSQIATLALASPDVFTDEMPTVYTLLTAYQDTSPDRIVGTLTATYTGKQGQKMQKSAITMSYTQATTVDDVGRAAISLGADSSSDLRYGTYDVQVYFDGIEIIDGAKGQKKVKTCETVNGDATIVVNRRNTNLAVQLV